MRLRIAPSVVFLAQFVAAAGLVSPALLRAQSLADVARQEQERRKAIKESGKVYTNDDLKGVPAPAADSSDTATPAGDVSKDGAAAGGKGASSDEKKTADAAKESKEPARDQKYWADRMAGLQTSLQRGQAFAEALQVQINALTTDFTNRDDPAQRAVVGENRQKALDELDRLKKQVEDDQKAIDDLEEEARRENVPPGWLR
jgi:DNA repair exonuclease SbcCD ATPase subunit